MNTLHLQYILEIEKTGSISHAADNLYMNQSTLSKIAKELESLVGIKIFERTSRGVIPTKLGREFLSYARNILEQEKLISNLSIEEKKLKNSFRISVPRASYLSHAFTEFVNDYGKQIICDFCETNSINVINNILERGFNFGIIRYNENYETYFSDYLKRNNLESNIIWEYRYDVIMSKNHPLAGEIEVSNEMLCEFCEIIHGDLQIPYLVSDESVENITENKMFVYERGSQFDILSSVNTTYMKVSPVPNQILERANLVERRLVDDKNKMRDVLVYRKNYEFNDTEELFIKKIFDVRDKLNKTDWK